MLEHFVNEMDTRFKFFLKAVKIPLQSEKPNRLVYIDYETISREEHPCIFTRGKLPSETTRETPIFYKNRVMI